MLVVLVVVVVNALTMNEKDEKDYFFFCIKKAWTSPHNSKSNVYILSTKLSLIYKFEFDNVYHSARRTGKRSEERRFISKK